jgi:glucose-1-phosphate cytidylyltransferase
LDVQIRHPVYPARAFLEAHLLSASAGGPLRQHRAIIETADLRLPENLKRQQLERVQHLLAAQPSPTVAPSGDALADVPVVVTASASDLNLESTHHGSPASLARVGGVSVLRHVIDRCVSQGAKEILICIDARDEHADAVRGHLLGSLFPACSLSLSLDAGVLSAEGESERGGLLVHMLNAAAETTLGRLRAAAAMLGERRILVVPGNVVCDLDASALLAAHESAGQIATIAVAKVSSIICALNGEVGRVIDAPPQTGQLRASGGMVLEPSFLHVVLDDKPFDVSLNILEYEEKIALYEHTGFWQDAGGTLKNAALQALYESGDLPWLR